MGERWQLLRDPRAAAMMRLADDRIMYVQNQRRGCAYVWTICENCGRLWYTLEIIRNVIKRGGCSRCLFPGGRKLAGVPGGYAIREPDCP